MAFTIAQVGGSDRISSQLQSNIQNALTTLSRNPLVGGTVLTAISLKASGDNAVAHKLGNPLQGWLVIRQRAAAQIYDKQDANSTPESTLILVTSADVTVDLYVF